MAPAVGGATMPKATFLPPGLCGRPLRCGGGAAGRSRCRAAAAWGSSQDQVLFTMMQTQTGLLDRLKLKKSPVGEDSIGGILAGSVDERGDGLRLPGAKGAAALEVFRAEARERPRSVARTIYRSVSGGVAWEPAGSIRVRRGRGAELDEGLLHAASGARLLAYLGFSTATAWGWLMEGEACALGHSKALLGLTCAAIEQVVIDSRIWALVQQHAVGPRLEE